MTKRLNDAREFARVYDNSTIPRLHIPRALRRRAVAISTLIINTPNLTDGSLTYSRTWSPAYSTTELFEAAHRALAPQPDAQAATYMQALSFATTHAAQSVAMHTSKETYSATYHHGAFYEHYIFGEPLEITASCDLSENERERILLQTRKLSCGGVIVCAVSRAESKLLEKQPGQDVFIGLVCLAQTVYTGTVTALARLRASGYRIIYASQDRSVRVSSLAHELGLIPLTDLPLVHANTRPAGNVAVYAELRDSELRHLLAGCDDAHTIVVKHPLPEFYRLLTSI